MRLDQLDPVERRVLECASVEGEVFHHGAVTELGLGDARVLAAFYRSGVVTEPDVDQLEGLARATVLQLEEVGDHAGLAEVWWVLARGVAAVRCHFEEQAHAAEQALAHSRVAGKEPPHLFGLHAAVTDGPRPAEDALRAIDAAMPGNTFHALQLNRARLLAMLGRFDEAWPVVLDADARMRELTDLDSGYGLAEIARLEGNDEKAIRYLSATCARLEQHEERAALATMAPALGRLLCAVGRFAEAEPLAQFGHDYGGEHDIETQILWREVQTLIHANRSKHARASELANEAVRLAERTDGLNMQGDAYSVRAETAYTAGRVDEAHVALAAAIDRYERKHNVVMAKRARIQRAVWRSDFSDP